MTAVGVDIGGTHCRFGAVDGDGSLRAFNRFPTPAHAGAQAFVDWMATVIDATFRAVDGDVRVSADVGVALPGLLDRGRGCLAHSVNLPFLEGFPLVEGLSRRPGRSTYLMTDAEAAVWGEYCALASAPPGAGRVGNETASSLDIIAHLRIGTGVALGVVSAARPLELDAGRRGHLDTLIVDRSEDARQCPCGKHGCLEAFVSGPVLTERAQWAGYSDGVADLQPGWEACEPQARRIIVEAAEALAQAIVAVAEAYRSRCVILGGGVVEVLPCLYAETVRLTGGYAAALPSTQLLRIMPSRLGQAAGVVGAGLLATCGKPEIRALAAARGLSMDRRN